MIAFPANSHDPILIHAGDFTQARMLSILDETEWLLNFRGEKTNVIRRIFMLSLETLQNMVKHADTFVRHAKSAVFALSSDTRGYNLRSANPVRKENVAPLTARLEKINSLNKAELDELYCATIRNVPPSDDGCCGLGWIDMARRSGRRLEYQFDEMTTGEFLFWLNINVPCAQP